MPVHSRLPHPVQRVAEAFGVKSVRPRVHAFIALSQLKVKIANNQVLLSPILRVHRFGLRTMSAVSLHPFMEGISRR